MTPRLRVLYILTYFPQLSETYIETELREISRDHDVSVVSRHPPDCPHPSTFPVHTLHEKKDIFPELFRNFRPDILHSHWLTNVPLVHRLATKFHVPYTIRAHSFDVLDAVDTLLPPLAKLINSELCLGILSFPFSRPTLERCGIHAEKIHESFPVMEYAWFYDRSPNGAKIMGTGACLPKKQMEDFIDLATMLPDQQFNLYSIGYDGPKIRTYNALHGAPVTICDPVPHYHMPAIYKQHQWLVVTARREAATVGLPLSVAEAQAAGVGVCIPALRPDLEDYLGGAGFLYTSLAEVRDIISQPFPAELREIGFENAKRSDIRAHKAILTALWDRVRT